MSFEMFQWIVEIATYYRIFLVSVCLFFFIRMNSDWWSFPTFILLSITLLATVIIIIINGNISEILIGLPVGILSIVLAIRGFSRRLNSGRSLYEGKGFDVQFPSLK